MTPNEEIRIWWSGEARFDLARARFALDEARKFAVNETDRKSGGRNCILYTFKAWPGQMLIYWTKARAVVVRFHQ